MYAGELFNARWHEERRSFLEALCCILLMTLCDFERFVSDVLLKNACQNHNRYIRTTDENGPNVVRRIRNFDYERALGAELEQQECKQTTSKI